MSDETATDNVIASRGGFDAKLLELLRTAYTNGIDVFGPWECRTSDSSPGWEVSVVEIVDEQDG